MKKNLWMIGCGWLLLGATVTWAQPPCGGMTKAKAAAILGCAAEEVQHRSSEELQTCSFSKDLFTSVHYALYHEKDEKSAQQSMGKIVSGLEMLVECTVVEGIGDAAVSCAGERAKRLLVRKGAVLVDVISPADLEQKKQVAAGVLE